MFLIRAAKTAGASTAAFVVAQHVTGGHDPLLAPLTALLVVQVTLWSTLRSSIDRVVSVVVGVLVAVGLSSLVGLTWWSLGTIIFAGLVVGWLLRLGPHLLEVPISAMLVLGISQHSFAAADRIVETLIGAAIGVLANVLIPPPVISEPVGDSFLRFVERVGGTLRRTAAELPGGWSVEDTRLTLTELRDMRGQIAHTESEIARFAESLRLNPRGRGAVAAPDSLRAAVTVLEHVLVSLRAAFGVLADGIEPIAGAPAFGPTERRDLAELLLRCGDAIEAFGRFAATDVTAPTSGEHLLERAADEARAALDRFSTGMLERPHTDMRVWGLRGSIVIAFDRILDEVAPARLTDANITRESRPPRALRGLLQQAHHATRKNMRQLRPRSAR
jgi:hypothetical protein